MNQPFYGVASMPSSHRPELFEDTENPGPGTYDRNKERHLVQLPHWSLKSRLQHGSCFQQLSTTPGPGGYESPSLFKKEFGNKSLSKGEKYRHYAQKCYPSNHLNLPGSMNLKGGYSFGYRDAFRDIERSPGPIYHLDQPIEEKRRVKLQNSFSGFGFGNKEGIYKKDDSTPGPGAFDTEKGVGLNKSKTCENWTFSISKRNYQLVKSGLGPGEYNPKMPVLNRSFKLRGKNQLKQIPPNNTGPGSYNIPDTKTKLGARISSPTSKRLASQGQPLQNDSTLSPFSYNPPRYLDKISPRGYSLGRKLEIIVNDNREKPGPGAYEVSPKQTRNKCGYMGRKFNQKPKENAMENFYKYDPKLEAVARESPKFSFPQGRKAIGKENEPLSPRSHEFTMSISPKQGGYSYSMGNSKRFPDFVQTGPLKLTQTIPTIGILPSYLKRSMIKKD